MGQVVMTGSVMKTVFPVEDPTYRFDLEQIGIVEVQTMGGGAILSCRLVSFSAASPRLQMQAQRALHRI